MVTTVCFSENAKTMLNWQNLLNRGCYRLGEKRAYGARGFRGGWKLLNFEGKLKAHFALVHLEHFFEGFVSEVSFRRIFLRRGKHCWQFSEAKHIFQRPHSCVSVTVTQRPHCPGTWGE